MSSEAAADYSTADLMLSHLKRLFFVILRENGTSKEIYTKYYARNDRLSDLVEKVGNRILSDK